jgi:hypothetical protein
MRTALAGTLLTTLLAVSLAACGASKPDPYDLLLKATSADWGAVQIEFGFSGGSGSEAIEIDRSAIRLILDPDAGKGSLHLALPIDALDLGVMAAQLGIRGDTIDFDAVYDGSALYARSPLLGALITFAYASSGELPSGDLSGWLRLGTADDYAALFEAAAPSSGPAASVGLPDAKTLKRELEANGVVVVYVGSEQRGGLEAHHLRATVDLAKLAEHEAFDSLDRAQIAQLEDLAKTMRTSAEVWLAASDSRLIEVVMSATNKTDPSDTFEFVIALSEPPAGTSFEAPDRFVDIPVAELAGLLMQLLGQYMLTG